MANRFPNGAMSQEETLTQIKRNIERIGGEIVHNTYLLDEQYRKKASFERNIRILMAVLPRDMNKIESLRSNLEQTLALIQELQNNIDRLKQERIAEQERLERERIAEQERLEEYINVDLSERERRERRIRIAEIERLEQERLDEYMRRRSESFPERWRSIRERIAAEGRWLDETSEEDDEEDDEEWLLPEPIMPNLEGSVQSIDDPQLNPLEMLRCPVCQENIKDIRLTCGHMVCNMCATRLRDLNQKCPMCRKDITSMDKVYYNKKYLKYKNKYLSLKKDIFISKQKNH
jgi:hypothetical protein